MEIDGAEFMREILRAARAALVSAIEMRTPQV
jgi:hypothetical protein